MYQAHFGFTQLPFNLTPNTELFYALEPHYEAIQVVLSALAMGEGIIKVSGEVGTGKTMVCRMLLKQLQSQVALIYLPNPVLTGAQLHQAVAKELAIEFSAQRSLIDDIQQALIDIHQSGRKAVVLLDEAQGLSDEGLEALRLLGNLETEQEKLLQMVLFGQPELTQRLNQYHLRQLRQRITFNANLRLLSLAETLAYIDNRVRAVNGEPLVFSHALKKAIWRSSHGNPRLINQLCHKSLLSAYRQQQQTVRNSDVYYAIHDTFDAVKPKFKTPQLWGWSSS